MPRGDDTGPLARSGRRALRRWQQDVAAGQAAVALRVGIAATFTSDPLAEQIAARALALGLEPQVFAGPYNQLIPVCLNPNSYFPAELDAIALFWRIEDYCPTELAAYQAGDSAALIVATAKVRELASAVGSLHQHFGGTLLVSTPPYPTAPHADPRDLLNATTAGRFHRALLDTWVQAITATSGILLVDVDALQRDHGANACFDARHWYLYRQPWREAFLVQVGDAVARALFADRRSAKKCVVVDCDNTLWGGIIGEDGLRGIALGDDFPGSAFRDFQRWLQGLRQRGVFLALLSKNNEADVWEVFDKHDAMLLRRSDVSAWSISWDPKPLGLERIAAALNIGLDSFVFIDDNAFEIEGMRAAHPQVVCIQVPEDTARFIDVVNGVRWFDNLRVTSEDRQRTDMALQEVERRKLSSTLSYEDYLRSLELRVEPFAVTEAQLARVVQLINKTNQFNLTTIRRSTDEVRALIDSERWFVYATQVADRFGEYGLTGVAIVEREGTELRLDSLLVSCRVLGRKVESAFLAFIAQEGRATGAKHLFASYIPTAKNAPCAGFLPEHGFSADPDGRLVAPLDALAEPPAHILVHRA